MKLFKSSFKFPKFFKSKDPYFNVIELGSSKVKVAVCKEGDDVKGQEILGEATQILGSSVMYGGKINDLDAVIETVNLALEGAVIKAGVTAKKTILGLSGGVMIPRSYRVRVKRKSPEEKINEEEFNVLADQIEDQTLEKAKAELEELHKQEYIRVESVFTNYTVDGAKVTTPLDLPGAEVEITVVHYFMESGKLRSINSLVDQLDLEIVSIVDVAIYTAIVWEQDQGDYVLVDVGGDVTSVVVIRDGKVAENYNLFIGGYDITDAIKNKLDVTFENAENIKISYAQGHLDQERARLVRQAVTEVVDLIIESFVTVVKSSKITHFPPKILVSGESRHLAELKSSFASYPWAKEPQFSVYPKIELVSGKEPNFMVLTETKL